MKKTHILTAGLVAIILVLAVALVRSNRPNAPIKDVSGATPTGQILTIKITSDVSTGFASIKRGDTMPVNYETVQFPFEQTYNVKSGEAFNLAAGGGKPGQSVKANLRISILYNGEEVASGVESDLSAAFGGAIPANGKKAYIASCAFTVP